MITRRAILTATIASATMASNQRDTPSSPLGMLNARSIGSTLKELESRYGPYDQGNKMAGRNWNFEGVTLFSNYFAGFCSSFTMIASRGYVLTWTDIDEIIQEFCPVDIQLVDQEKISNVGLDIHTWYCESKWVRRRFSKAEYERAKCDESPIGTFRVSAEFQEGTSAMKEFKIKIGGPNSHLGNNVVSCPAG